MRHKWISLGLLVLGLWGSPHLAAAQQLDPQNVPSQTVSRTLNWNAVVTNTDGTASNLTGYLMYRSMDNGSTWAKQSPTIPPTILTWTDTNVPTGNICYEVAALNAVGESGRSNRVCFSMPSALPNPPTQLSVNGAVATMSAPKAKKK